MATQCGKKLDATMISTPSTVGQLPTNRDLCLTPEIRAGTGPIVKLIDGTTAGVSPESDVDLSVAIPLFSPHNVPYSKSTTLLEDHSR
jgi:hypothetical protein